MKRRDLALGAALFFALYALTRYPGVGGRINQGDSAKFQFLPRVLGVGHPPGNPLYLLATQAWVRIPLPIDDATKVTLFSSACAVVTLVLVAATSALLAPRRPLLAPLALGLGSLFWTLATEAEVYSLATVFLAATVYGAARWTVERRPSGLVLALAAFTLGLGNHLSSVALVPALLWLIVRARTHRVPALAAALATGLVAAGTYACLPWLAAHGTYSELPTPTTRDAFLDFVTAKRFRPGLAAPSLSAAVFERLPTLARGLQDQWPWPMLLLLPSGIHRMLRRHPECATFLLLATFGYAAFAFVYRISDPEGFFLPIVVLLSLFVPFVAGGGRARTRLTGTVIAASMLLVAGAHLDAWAKKPPAAYVQTTPEGQIAVAYPTLAQAVPEGAVVGVPCGHYGCVEVTNYFHLVDETFHARNVSFVSFPWSEWDAEHGRVPRVDAPAKLGAPICVFAKSDREKLTALGLSLREVKRPAERVLWRVIEPASVYCTR